MKKKSLIVACSAGALLASLVLYISNHGKDINSRAGIEPSATDSRLTSAQESQLAGIRQLPERGAKPSPETRESQDPSDPVIATREDDSLPISTSDPQSITNIRGRQALLQQHWNRLDSGELMTEEEYWTAAKASSQLAVQIIFDATARSRGQDTLLRGEVQPTGVGAVHRHLSGGRYYEIPYGEFPEYDKVMDLQAKHNFHVPPGEIPLDEIGLRATYALRYDAR